MTATDMRLQADEPCKITIAICTYNRIGTLPRTLASLLQLRGDIPFEVIVVNGPSTDGTAEYLDAQARIRVFSNPETNLSISRNIAIANAAGEYISFIDDDAIPEPDWLQLVVAALEAAPDLSAVGGFIRDSDGIQYQARYVACDALGRGYYGESPEYVALLSKGVKTFPSLTGTNVTFRMSDLRKVGGFDETYAYFYDETDVNKRMDDAGMRARVIPEAEIHHKYAPSHLRTENRVPNNMYPIAKSVGYFSIRHGAPEFGWEKAVERLQTFYASEFKWKVETLTAGNIDKPQFERLMQQTAKGLTDGIEAAFEAAGKRTATQLREQLERHTQPDSAPIIRRTRADAPENLRLCMFAQDHAAPRQGGIGRWTNLVARGLAERGHEVTVMGHLRGNYPREYADFTAYGYWSHNLTHFAREAGRERDCLGLPNSVANPSKRYLSEIERIQPRRQFQVASSPIWDVEGAALIASGMIPTVLSLHTCTGLILPSKPEWTENETYYKNHVLRVMNAEIQALSRVPMILANSQAIMRDISDTYEMDLFSRPYAVVPHGIEDIAEHKGLLEARQAAHAGADPTPLRLLFLGRLETRKGIGHLVPVLHQLLTEFSDLQVDLVGDRTDQVNFDLVQGLLEAYPGNVTWHGYLSDDELDPLMRQTDIFVAPSLYESFGLIYIEAARYAIPSVGFATGGVPEVVTHGTDGLLAETGDEAGLLAALRELVINDELRNNMSLAARKSFETRFHYNHMAAQLEEVYQQARGS